MFYEHREEIAMGCREVRGVKVSCDGDNLFTYIFSTRNRPIGKRGLNRYLNATGQIEDCFYKPGIQKLVEKSKCVVIPNQQLKPLRSIYLDFGVTGYDWIEVTGKNVRPMMEICSMLRFNCCGTMTLNHEYLCEVSRCSRTKYQAFILARRESDPIHHVRSLWYNCGNQTPVYCSDALGIQHLYDMNGNEVWKSSL